VNLVTNVRERKPRESYDPEFFEKLVRVENRHFWFRARNQVITNLVKQVTQLLPGGYRVLEVGCGTGNVLRALERACPSGIVVGMDLFAEGLAFARSRTSCALVQGDLERPGFGVPFDVIGAFDVIEHIPDDLHVLRAIHSMLCRGGALILTVPAHPSLWSYFDEASHHCRRYEMAELQGKLRQCDYEVEFASEFMASIYPLLWTVRRFGRLRRNVEQGRGEDDDMQLALRELRIVPVLNELISFALMQEAFLIKSRISLPFGSSLVAVARRAK
jgi:SAM-dependent methyltransferase